MSQPKPKDTNELIEGLYKDLAMNLRFLAGEEVSPSGQSWPDIVRTVAAGLRELAFVLEAVEGGGKSVYGIPISRPVVFPSLDDL